MYMYVYRYLMIGNDAMRKKAEKGHVCICVAAWQDSDGTYQMLPSSHPREQ